MNKKDEHCHYSDLPSPKAYERDDIDYDGMGNQGRVPVNNTNKKDYIAATLWVTIVLIWSLIIISLLI